MVEVGIEMLAGVAVTILLMLVFLGVVVMWDIALALRDVSEKIDSLEDDVDSDLDTIDGTLTRIHDRMREQTQQAQHLANGGASPGVEVATSAVETRNATADTSASVAPGQTSGAATMGNARAAPEPVQVGVGAPGNRTAPSTIGGLQAAQPSADEVIGQVQLAGGRSGRVGVDSDAPTGTVTGADASAAETAATSKDGVDARSVSVDDFGASSVGTDVEGGDEPSEDGDGATEDGDGATDDGNVPADATDVGDAVGSDDGESSAEIESTDDGEDVANDDDDDDGETNGVGDDDDETSDADDEVGEPNGADDEVGETSDADDGEDEANDTDDVAGDGTVDAPVEWDASDDDGSDEGTNPDPASETDDESSEADGGDDLTAAVTDDASDADGDDRTDPTETEASEGDKVDETDEEAELTGSVAQILGTDDEPDDDDQVLEPDDSATEAVRTFGSEAQTNRGFGPEQSLLTADTEDAEDADSDDSDGEQTVRETDDSVRPAEEDDTAGKADAAGKVDTADEGGAMADDAGASNEDEERADPAVEPTADDIVDEDEADLRIVDDEQSARNAGRFATDDGEEPWYETTFDEAVRKTGPVVDRRESPSTFDEDEGEVTVDGLEGVEAAAASVVADADHRDAIEGAEDGVHEALEPGDETVAGEIAGETGAEGNNDDAVSATDEGGPAAGADESDDAEANGIADIVDRELTTLTEEVGGTSISPDVSSLSLTEGVTRLDDTDYTLPLSGASFDLDVSTDNEVARLEFESRDDLELSGASEQLLWYQLQNYLDQEETAHAELAVGDDRTVVLEIPGATGPSLDTWADAMIQIVDRTLYLTKDSD